MVEKRSLYQCANARVKSGRIYCAAGYRLEVRGEDGKIPIQRLIRGAPLVMQPCQTCEKYDEMGPPVPKEKRGWMYK